MFDISDAISDSDENHNPEREHRLDEALALAAVNRPAYEALRDEGWEAAAKHEGRGRSGAELRAEVLATIGGTS